MMGSCHAFVRNFTRGLIILLLLNAVQLSTIKRNVDVRASEVAVRTASEAIIEQFPHQVSLRLYGSWDHYCGGSLISAQWVLTTAHCAHRTPTVQFLPSQISAVAGSLRLNETPATLQQSSVRTIIVHPNYDYSTLENDVSVLQLWASFNLINPAVQPQVLRESTVSVGTNCQIAGWGMAVYASSLSATNSLLYANSSVIEHSVCVELYAEHSYSPSDGTICAGYIGGSEEGCEGDSGAGLICDGQLSGFVSFGMACTTPSYPRIYTDVSQYRDWILAAAGLASNSEADSGSSGTGNGNSANTIQSSFWMEIITFIVVGLVTAS